MASRMSLFFKWFEPLVTDYEQETGRRSASRGSIMGWFVFFLDIFVVIFVVMQTKELTHVNLVFNFLELFTLFILTYMFSHKVIMMKTKTTQPLGFFDQNKFSSATGEEKSAGEKQDDIDEIYARENKGEKHVSD